MYEVCDKISGLTIVEIDQLCGVDIDLFFLMRQIARNVVLFLGQFDSRGLGGPRPSWNDWYVSLGHWGHRGTCAQPSASLGDPDAYQSIQKVLGPQRPPEAGCHYTVTKMALL